VGAAAGVAVFITMVFITMALSPTALPAQTGGSQPSSLQPSPIQLVGPPPDCPPDKEFCVRAERTGGIDLKTGVIHLEGNVVGFIRSRGLTFSGQVLKAFRKGKHTWERLVLEKNVRLTLKKKLISDQETGEQASGNSRTPAREGTMLLAQRAELAMNTGQMKLSGNVRIEQGNGKLRMMGQSIVLSLDETSALQAFKMEGNIEIAQPGRIITADRAESRNALRTILLIGNASVKQKGAFDFQSERMEVYTDVGKGVLKSSDEKKPITLTLDLDAGKPYQLKREGMISLADQGLPASLLEKLAPILNRRFESRASLMEAVEDRITPEESEAYLETVAKAASL
jgi:lipopolysaccharide export system protein LptA